MRVVLVLLVATALTGCMGTGPGPVEDAPGDTLPGPAVSGDSLAETLANYGADGDPILGDATADVQVVAYDAPGCSSCRYYHDNNFPAVKQDFIDTGRIGYHFVQWTVGYAYDTYASIGLECLHREGGSRAYADGVDRAFANQTYGRWGDAHDDGVRAWLSDVAGRHGIDQDAVVACYDTEATLSEVEADIAAGKESGAGFNPGFVIISGDQIRTVQGAQGPYDAISEALAT